MNIEPDRLRDVFCFRDERLVSKQLAFSCERQRIILAENELTRDLPGKYVDTFAFPDGSLDIRWKGVSIPYTVFDKDQRVTHAAITENKRLGAVLEHMNFVPVSGHWGTLPLSMKGAPNGTPSTEVYGRV